MTRIQRVMKRLGVDEKTASTFLHGRIPGFREYWKSQGFSDIEIKKKERAQNPTHFEYWLNKGYSEEEAKRRVRIKKKNCKDYWLNKGYSEEEAQNLASDKAKQSNQACKEYWLKMGLPLDQAISEAKKHGCHFESAHKSFSRKQNRFCYEYWLNKGYSEEEAKIQAKLENRRTTSTITKKQRSKQSKDARAKWSNEFKGQLNQKLSIKLKQKKKTHSPIFEEYWIANGYTKEQAKQLVRETKFGSQANISRASKVELRFFSELQEYLGDSIVIELQKWVYISGHNFCQDGRYKNFVIEFNGTNFHMDPRFYDNTCKNPRGVDWDEVKKKDQIKLDCYALKKYNVFVVWEYDFLNHQQELFKILKQRIIDNECNKEGSYWDSASIFNKC